ncbi:MAG: hypothetical protein BRD50_09340 [Bacteroidetes bacterium SW_11_45_7]|nr:MAG: hypothetical protein BRD50_09340 [Bacteroidetes bacterium SW_11_45_7]
MSVQGGVTPYSYNWSNGRTNQDIQGVTAGTYTVTVTDDNGCTILDTAVIEQPDPLTLGVSTTPVSSQGAEDGAIDLTVFGGTSPYDYLWSTGDTTQDIDSLSKGTYTVTVTDDSGCVAVVYATVDEPTSANLSSYQTSKQNQYPTAQNDAASTFFNSAATLDVLSDDSDPEALIDTASVAVYESPSNGSTVSFANGSIEYTPASNFTGQDTFRYRMCDQGAPVLCDSAMVVITVKPGVNVSANALTVSQ